MVLGVVNCLVGEVEKAEGLSNSGVLLAPKTGVSEERREVRSAEEEGEATAGRANCAGVLSGVLSGLATSSLIFFSISFSDMGWICGMELRN